MPLPAESTPLCRERQPLAAPCGGAYSGGSIRERKVDTPASCHEAPPRYWDAHEGTDLSANLDQKFAAHSRD
jgi:hypothetical protein